MRLSLGYPNFEAERELLQRGHVVSKSAVDPCISAEQLMEMRAVISRTTLSDSLLGYIQRLTAFTREAPEFLVGLSPRGALALVGAAKTWAQMEGRNYVAPDDVQAVLAPVIAHRLIPSADYAGDGNALVALLRSQVDVIPG
jgi:MoxR-like ATPase